MKKAPEAAASGAFDLRYENYARAAVLTSPWQFL
jgi:hypothetical protein